MRLVVRWLCAVPVLACAFGCAPDPQQVCVDRLSVHFSALKTLTGGESASPGSLAEARTTLAQLLDLAQSADVQGCDSKTVFAVNEFKAGIMDLQAAMSDDQILMHGLFSLFDAGESSPLSQAGKAAKKRLDAAGRLLTEVGVRGPE